MALPASKVGVSRDQIDENGNVIFSGADDIMEKLDDMDDKLDGLDEKLDAIQASIQEVTTNGY